MSGPQVSPPSPPAPPQPIHPSASRAAHAVRPLSPAARPNIGALRRVPEQMNGRRRSRRCAGRSSRSTRLLAMAPGNHAATSGSRSTPWRTRSPRRIDRRQVFLPPCGGRATSSSRTTASAPIPGGRLSTTRAARSHDGHDPHQQTWLDQHQPPRCPRSGSPTSRRSRPRRTWTRAGLRPRQPARAARALLADRPTTRGRSRMSSVRLTHKRDRSHPYAAAPSTSTACRARTAT